MAVALVALVGCGTRLPSGSFAAGDSTLGTAATSPTGTPPTSQGQTQPASDVGITSNEIRVGLIVSQTSPLGSETFSPPMYGALAYFQALNARGGIHGRMVRVITCDDGSTGTGNLQCAHKLVDVDKVFAFAGNSIFNYQAAAFVSAHDVPDVGGQPIDNAYDQYPHLYSIYGSDSPRDGRTVGFDGKLYGGTEVYRYFKEALGARTAGVVYYNQSDSQRFGDLTVAGLQVEGYQIVREQVDFAVPNFDAAAIDMRAHHVDVVFDALDSNGNVNLCKSMDAAHLTVKAKATTVQSWDDTARTQYAGSPVCRNSLYATGTDRNYEDTQFAAVAQFRSDIHTAFPERDNRVSAWELEGWASAQWLTDALTSCGAAPTRACIESYLETVRNYDGHGVFTGRDFQVNTHPGGQTHNCLTVAQWQDSAQAGRGGWVTRSPGKNYVCFDVPSIPYTP
ncbi:MAG: ABC transporter substrate-binding protein [Acidimicrobiales bacterium]